MYFSLRNDIISFMFEEYMEGQGFSPLGQGKKPNITFFDKPLGTDPVVLEGGFQGQPYALLRSEVSGFDPRRSIQIGGFLRGNLPRTPSTEDLSRLVVLPKSLVERGKHPLERELVREGYQPIGEILRDLDQRGYFQEQIQRLVTQFNLSYAQNSRLIELIMAEAKSQFPEFSVVGISLPMEEVLDSPRVPALYFAKPGGETSPYLGVEIEANSFVARVGKVALKDGQVIDFSAVSPEYPELGKDTWIFNPKMRQVWREKQRKLQEL